MKVWLIIQTLAFESFGFYLIFDKPVTVVSWIAFASNHAIACGSFSALCWLILPRKYKTPVISSLSFLFFFNFFLPLIGMIGTSLSLLTALYLPRQPSIVSWQEHSKTPLPLYPGEINQTQFGEGALQEILLHSTDSERRLMAVSAVRHLPLKQAVPLLKLALKDLVDDVRLLAYASLEGIETHINESITLYKKQYRHTPTSSKAYEVAQQYWELCYLGIAEGILKRHYLHQAEQYLHESIKLDPMASSYLLLGRVLLAQNRPSEAVPALRQAMAGGLLIKQVAPYLAEAAYRDGDYESAREYIAYFPKQKGDQLSQIKEYWK